MNVRKAFLWALPLSLLSSLGATAFARTIQMTVLPLLDGPTAGCPESLTAYETPRPQTPGGFATDGMIQLRAVASNIAVAQKTPFTVTWTGKLKPEYRNCQASAGMSVVDGQNYSGHSYIRTQFINGDVTVILDMTGMRDANGNTDAILSQTLRDGNPRWAWGGTD